MKRCSRCIMPESAIGITFDEDNQCTLCRNFKPFIPKGEEALKQEIKDYIPASANPNCVVPVSGGRDSSYALYYVKRVLGLSPIAVHNNNDFETEIAARNLENITKSLNVTLLSVSSPANTAKKIVAEKIKMNAPFGPDVVVAQACEACKYGFESASYNTARGKKLQLVIWGDSTNESTASYHALQTKNTPTKWRRLLTPGVINLLKYKYHFRTLKKEYGLDSSYALKEIHLYDYVEWDRNTIINTITTELGWSKPEGSPTSWRIDCSLVPLINFLTKKAYGVSKIELGFSNMVRNKQMLRDDALHKVKQIEKATDITQLKKFLVDLNISASSINRLLQ